jgi:hypothetical protein
MLISDLTNREDVLSKVMKELNSLGIKIRSEKQKNSNVSYFFFFSGKSLKFSFCIILHQKLNRNKRRIFQVCLTFLLQNKHTN